MTTRNFSDEATLLGAMSASVLVKGREARRQLEDVGAASQSSLFLTSVRESVYAFHCGRPRPAAAQESRTRQMIALPRKSNEHVESVDKVGCMR
jgi:hypothetical protein